MRHLVLLAVLSVPASSVAQPPANKPLPQAPRSAGAKLDCVVNRVEHANQLGTTKPRRLDELPAGKLYLSVMREIDGCQEMVLVSEERGRAFRR